MANFQQLTSRHPRHRTTNKTSPSALLVHPDHKCHVPIVFDTGCSHSVTPFLDDFVSELEDPSTLALTGLTDSVKVEGEGWVEWPIKDYFGQSAIIRTRAYYIPTASVRLYSPQEYMAENKNSDCQFDHVELTHTLANGIKLRFPFSLENNLPLMLINHDVCTADFTSHEAFCLRREAAAIQDQIEDLLSNRNYNLSKPQKELLLWHYRLGHAGMSWLQELMRPKKDEVGIGKEPPVLAIKQQTTSRCEHPRCAACLVHSQRRSATW